MIPGESGMVFDRALTPELFDVGLRVATRSSSSDAARRLLTVALRDHVSEQEAEGKTKKCLTRVWVRPPPQAREMVRWAVEHQHLDPDRTLLHLGALLGTFPFAGVVAATIGRQLQLDGEARPLSVRAQVCAKFGDRSTIDIGARKVTTTFRYLGLLEPTSKQTLVVGRQPVVPPELWGWITHALMHTRRVEAVALDELSAAPELFTIKIGAGGIGSYSLLEEHAEGDRRVAVQRPALVLEASAWT